MRNKKAPKNKRLKWIKEFLIYVVIIVFCATLFPKYVIRRTQVDGNSMETTLQDKDDLIVEKVTYHFKDPDRFDIITFYPKGRNAKTPWAFNGVGSAIQGCFYGLASSLQVPADQKAIDLRKLFRHLPHALCSCL